ncbi:MAG TPA: SDR family NAD(P)-dependent oxidoreductase [bacterium]|nr:SDR family NAD(P)-dependent oxidoreductase [bacterium]
MSLRGRVAIVTGATGDIGRAAARRLAAEGARLVLSDKDPGALEEVGNDVGTSGTPPFVARADITREDEIQGAVERALGCYGHIDILVNCAGVSDGCAWGDTDLREWTRQVAANLTGVFLWCRATTTHMRARHYGKIVNVASSAGRYRSSYFRHKTSHQTGVSYAASHGGVLALTRELAFELAHDGVYVNAVVPGLIQTGPFQDEWTRLSEWVRDAILTESSLGRLGRPDEVAAVVSFLASEASSYITGTAIDVNGGWWVS